MKKKILLGLFLLTNGLAFSQDQKSMKYAQTITAEDLNKYLSILASDSLEGRATAERGQKMAADYIKNKFKDFGLKAVGDKEKGEGYYQEFDLEKKTWNDVYVKAKKVKKNNLEGMLYYGNVAINEPVQTELIFVGGGDEKDYEGLEVKDKAVAFFVEPNTNSERKMRLAKEKGATAFIIIFGEKNEDLNAIINQYGHYLTQPSLGFSSSKPKTQTVQYLVTPEVAASLLKVKTNQLLEVKSTTGEERAKAIKKIKPAKFEYRAERKIEVVQTENVMGLVEGTDKKDEIIVITAHYDHIGVEDGKVFNGADDDGSGTSAVIELAEAFAKAKKDGNGPRRSILFMTVSGEEKGLLGSQYYVENPIFPLKNTVTNLNIDMIGRIDDNYGDNPDYIYLIGSDKLSKELHELSENINSTYSKLELDYRYNDENDPNRYYYRSDHYNFAKNNIPVIFYFNGTHADYHKDTDTIEKIHFGKMEKITRLVFYTAWEIANRDERIKMDKK
jgi:hypothetical protein